MRQSCFFFNGEAAYTAVLCGLSALRAFAARVRYAVPYAGTARLGLCCARRLSRCAHSLAAHRPSSAVPPAPSVSLPKF